jgi:hypothetical protein
MRLTLGEAGRGWATTGAGGFFAGFFLAAGFGAGARGFARARFFTRPRAGFLVLFFPRDAMARTLKKAGLCGKMPSFARLQGAARTAFASKEPPCP